jgi:hypothetical protein
MDVGGIDSRTETAQIDDARLDLASMTQAVEQERCAAKPTVARRGKLGWARRPAWQGKGRAGEAVRGTGASQARQQEGREPAEEDARCREETQRQGRARNRNAASREEHRGHGEGAGARAPRLWETGARTGRKASRAAVEETQTETGVRRAKGKSSRAPWGKASGRREKLGGRPSWASSKPSPSSWRPGGAEGARPWGNRERRAQRACRELGPSRGNSELSGGEAPWRGRGDHGKPGTAGGAARLGEWTVGAENHGDLGKKLARIDKAAVKKYERAKRHGDKLLGYSFLFQIFRNSQIF